MSDLIEHRPFKRQGGEHDRGAGRIEAGLARLRAGAMVGVAGAGKNLKTQNKTGPTDSARLLLWALSRTTSVAPKLATVAVLHAIKGEICPLSRLFCRSCCLGEVVSKLITQHNRSRLWAGPSFTLHLSEPIKVPLNFDSFRKTFDLPDLDVEMLFLNGEVDFH